VLERVFLLRSNFMKLQITDNIKNGDKLTLAVSGGVDSMVMLHLLMSLKDELNLTLNVAHLNHNLRGEESQRDYDFVKAQCKRLGLKFYGKKLNVKDFKDLKGRSTQDWARLKRYDFLEEVRVDSGSKHILTAHNSDDRVETFFIKLIKGSSTKGLSGLRAKNGKVLRPMLNTSRNEIEDYSRKHKVKFVEDSTNKSKKYLRNQIRIDLIPFLEKEFNPKIKESVSSAVSLLEADDRFISSLADDLFKDSLIKRNLRGKIRSIGFDLSKLRGKDKALLYRVFIKAQVLVTKDSGVITKHCKAFVSACNSKKPNMEFSLSGGLIRKEYDKLFITNEKSDKEIDFNKTLPVPGTLKVKEAGKEFRVSLIKKKPIHKRIKHSKVEFFDYDLMKDKIVVRNYNQGDSISPYGMSGTKKLKKVFMEEKIPLKDRKEVAVLEMLANKKIIWAAGVRSSSHFKVSGKTKNILKIEMEQL